jgi:hypothetical protein
MIYKLSYIDRETGLKDLENKNICVLDTETSKLITKEDIKAVVELGKKIKTQAILEIVEGKLKVITPKVYEDGYNFDVMTDLDIDFGDALINPKNPYHSFWQEKIIK